LPLAGCVWPQLADLDWKGAGLALEAREANGSDAVGVSGAFAAIAETGTLVFASGPDTPSTVSLLPETHVAVVSARRIVAHMEDAWALARAELRQLPRAINFVSGLRAPPTSTRRSFSARTDRTACTSSSCGTRMPELPQSMAV